MVPSETLHAFRHHACKLVLRGRSLLVDLGEIGLGDPAGDNTRLHDQASASSRDASLASRMPGCFMVSPSLLHPAGQIVGGAAGRSSTVLMSFSPNSPASSRSRRARSSKRLPRPVPRCASSSDSSCFRYCGRGAAVRSRFPRRSLDAGEIAQVHKRQILHRAETFRRQQLADNLVDVEGSVNTRVEFSKSAWRRPILPVR